MPPALPDMPRKALAKAVRNRIAGDDFDRVHNRIWHTPGERWFGPSDAIWRVHADTSMFIGGIRALLLQSLHPVAMWGVSEHSGFRGDPWGRLHRTSTFLAMTTYGSVPDAERSIAAVRSIHRRVQGTMPDGRRYSAEDPHLLQWIHIAEIDSFLVAHQRFGRQPLTATESDDYVAQSGLVAEKLGVVEVPGSVAEMADMISSFRPELTGSPAAHDAAALLLRDPPLPAIARIGYAPLAAGAVSLLPVWARTALGLPTLPVTDRLLIQPLARSMSSAFRWALSGPQSA